MRERALGILDPEAIARLKIILNEAVGRHSKLQRSGAMQASIAELLKLPAGGERLHQVQEVCAAKFAQLLGLKKTASLA